VIIMGSENLSNGSSTAADRAFGVVGPYRQNRRDAADAPDTDLAPRNGATPTMESANGLAPSLALEGLAEPVYPPQGWLEHTTPAPAMATMASMADHPLLRGLLLELPPRGSVPPPGWLDRWFEAARSILELLYQENSRQR
jgi:hypothetical protein